MEDPEAADRLAPADASRTTRALDWMNAFLADVRDGLGPYLAIYLVAVRGPTHGWDEATAGMVIAHVAGNQPYRSGYLLSP